MDFLDPAKKKSQKIKLFIGHTLMVILVVVGTFILVYQAYGFDVDRKTGEVIQNGLVFVDSAPDEAEIKLNGQVQENDTNIRLALPEGHYDLEINKAGYRTWSKSFDLSGGEVLRFVYPTLFLNQPSQAQLDSYSSVDFMSQSPDRRWVILFENNKLNNLVEYDLNSLKDEKPTKQRVPLPGNLFADAGGNHTLELVEWSTDNKNVLVKHTFKGGNEFVVVNRDVPEESFNVNRSLSQNPSQVRLRDKRVSELYIYFEKTGVLSSIKTGNKELTPIASNVISFEPHGNDVLAMAMKESSDAKTAKIVVREGEETFEVRQMIANKRILLAIAQYDGDWYLAAHDPVEQLTYIYKNPVAFMKRQNNTPPAYTVLRSIGSAHDVSFSQNTQFISVRSGQRFRVYDLEYQDAYRYEIQEKFDKNTKVEWMDGHRFITNSGGKVIIFEFDGKNLQTLVDSVGGLPAVFNRDYTTLYNLSGTNDKKQAFNQTFLRLEEDR